MIPRAGTAQRGVRDLREKSGKSSVTEINDDDFKEVVVQCQMQQRKQEN